MEHTARLAGFIAAHAIWSVSTGDMLVPMVGSESAGGERTLERLVTELAEDGVARGRQQLAENPRKMARAALAFDGYITLPDGKTDAVIVEARAYDGGETAAFEIAVPYRSANAPGGFAVHRPKLLHASDPATVQPMLEAFWAGVDAHHEAAAVWNAHIDPSR